MQSKVLIFLACMITGCPNDLHCLSCFGQSCSRCANSVASSDARSCQFPLMPIENCFIYERDGFCVECNPGFFATSLGKCDKIPSNLENCLIPQENLNGCLVCTNGIISKEGECLNSFICSDPNCSSCFFDNEGKEKCLKCKKGFFKLVSFHQGEECSIN